MREPHDRKLPLLGLGGSAGTSDAGITAPVLVVSSFEELERRSSEAKGKIVLFNAPFTRYDETVKYRVEGASAAAKAGAVAALVRSITPLAVRLPHTGMLRYVEGVPRIPHAAITLEDADLMARLSARRKTIVVNLRMGAKTLPDAESRNLFFEIRGHERPNEIVAMGGHIDSWDVGQGAQDDAAGCFAAWHGLRTIKRLGLRPRRTVRVVFWTNEENGGRGASAYAEAHARERHVLAIETDEGTFAPKGFAYEGGESAEAVLKEKVSLLRPLGSLSFERGFAGADVQPLKERYRTPVLGLVVQGERYFWYHHTDADTVDKVNADDLNRCAGALGALAFAAADHPGEW
jgi:carboxypeptidase Q